jgi:hypothetical protein
LIIVVNAIFLQSGVHPAPFFANPTALPQTTGGRLVSPSALSSTPPGPGLPSSSLPSSTPPSTRTPDRVIDMAPGRAAPAARTQAATVARRNDPIGDLIGTSTTSVGSSARIAAVQRVLSEFGYGQLHVSGAIDEPTSAAIQRFEADHKLPVTGRLSDRLLSELATMTGHPIQ